MTAADPKVLEEVQSFLDRQKLAYGPVEEKYCMRLVVKNGPSEASVSVYNSGKIVVGGKDSPLRKPRQGADLSIRFRSPSPAGTTQVLRIDLYDGGARLGLRFQQGLGRRFVAAFPALAVSASKSRIICTLKTEEQMVAVLDWVSPQLQGSR